MNNKSKDIPMECPWCGAPGTLVVIPLWDQSKPSEYYGNYVHYVECGNPKCKIRPKTRPYNDVYEGTFFECNNSAINDWNDRKQI